MHHKKADKIHTTLSSDKLCVAAYCRVSTPSGEQENSLQNQIDYYTSYINNNANWENAGVYAEKESGVNIRNRTEFTKMMTACRKGKINLILTKSISRFGRNTLETLRSLEELKWLDIEVIFDVEKIQLQSPNNRIVLTLFAAHAQAESEEKSKNICWGVWESFKSGDSGYNNFVCYGYKRGKDGTLEIDEQQAEIVRMTFQIYADGYSLQKISDRLAEIKVKSPTGKPRWSRETLNKLLSNEKVIGNVRLQKTFVDDFISGKQIKNNGQRGQILVENNHEGIVDVELFEAVQRRKAK